MKKREKTNQKILDSAREAFIEKGFHGTDIGYIASRVGIDKRTIYRYYTSKEALGFAVWTDFIITIMDVGKNANGKTGYEKLCSTLNKYIRAIKQNTSIVRFLGEFDHVFSGEYPNIDEAHEFVKHIKRDTNYIAQYINEGYKDMSIKQDIDCELVSRTISNMLLALSQRIVIRGEHLNEEQGYSYEMLDAAVSMILNSIKA